MWGLIIEFGILATDYTINYLNRKDPPPPPKQLGLQMPTVEDGAAYPLIYGRTRVRKPVIAWQDTPLQVLRSAGLQNFYDYYLSMHFVMGLGFLDGQQNIWNIWAGDAKMRQFSVFPSVANTLGDLVGDGNFEDTAPSHREVLVALDSAPGLGGGQVLAEGMVEFLNGNASQLLVDDVPSYVALTRLGQHMTVTQTVGDFSTYGTIDPRLTSGYRGLISVFLTGRSATGHWYVGTATQVQTYSFEISSYPVGASYPSQGLYQKIGTDANPADILYDLLTGKRGKLGLDPALIDMVSFKAAAYTLWQEGNGCSFAIEDRRTGVQIIQSILDQIDGTLYEDPTTGLLGIKLIRNDYDPALIPVINASNCTDLTGLKSTGWANLPNKIRITFSDNTNDYNQGSAAAQNLANGVGQDGLVNELVLDMPFVTNATLARGLAGRELGSRSRPLLSCTANVDRSFDTVKPGDVVRVNWTSPDLAGVIFRVVAVNQGAPSKGTIALQLVQDTYYVFGNRPPILTGFGRLGDETQLAVF